MNLELLGRTDWKPWKNDGSVTVGSLELIQITGRELLGERQVALGKQPDDPAGKMYVVNGPMSVAAGKYGVYQPNGTEVLVVYKGSDPSVDDQYGPKDGQGTAEKDGKPNILTVIGVVDSTAKTMAAWLGTTAQSAVRWFLGTTTGAVTAGNDFTVSGLTAIDGGDLPDPDNTSPDTWDVDNGLDIGAGHTIDNAKVIMIMEFADGTRRPVDAPCPTSGT